MRLMMPVIGIAMVVVAAAIVFTFKIVWDDYAYNQRLVSIEVTAPDGWEVVPYETAHGEAIVNEALAARDTPATTTQGLLRQLADISVDEHKGAVWTFANAEELVVVNMVYGPHRPKRNSIFAQMKLASAGAPKPNLDIEVATVAGRPLILKPRISNVPGAEFPEPVNYRRFNMSFGDEEIDEVLNIAVLTNSSDAAVASALMGINLERANGLLPMPDPTVDAEAGIVTPDQQPLSSALPEPSVAYKALELLVSGRDFGTPWTEALQRVKAGEIADWDAFILAYPDSIEEAPFELLTLLNDGSEEISARSFAATMIDSGREWNAHEHYILTKVVDLESAQSDFEEYMSGDYDIADEVMALIARLPETRATAPSETPDVNARPAVSTGFGQSSQCRIENGVRRCSVGGN
ncbi:hypothetical protein [Yoonia maritima]|uniref:hypothetical protein n=1 Tax=Yoonia maritima TaxID=1435347 RepID=UPI003736E021